MSDKIERDGSGGKPDLLNPDSLVDSALSELDPMAGMFLQSARVLMLESISPDHFQDAELAFSICTTVASIFTKAKMSDGRMTESDRLTLRAMHDALGKFREPLKHERSATYRRCVVAVREAAEQVQANQDPELPFHVVTLLMIDLAFLLDPRLSGVIRDKGHLVRVAFELMRYDPNSNGAPGRHDAARVLGEIIVLAGGLDRGKATTAEMWAHNIRQRMKPPAK